VRTCRDQFISTPVTVENTDRRHSVIPRTDHVVSAIADHDRLPSDRAGFVKGMT
jgi:hypothetical protein